MRKVEPYNDSVFLSRGSDFLDLEQLAGEKVHTAKHHDGQFTAMLVNEVKNVFCSNRELAFPRSGENERVFWIEPVMCYLGFDRVGIGRERRLFHQDFETRF